MNTECRKDGVAGFMRVKNDAEFVEASIDSCVDALDELVIVYNDCSDDTPVLVEKKRMEYPDKIKVFEYRHKVYSVNLTKEEYDYASGLPDDAPGLLCNYYNYALSKVSYKYAVKIDADQIYFTDRLRMLCDIFRNGNKRRNLLKYSAGWAFNMYFVAYKFLCFRIQRAYGFLPARIVEAFSPCYMEYLRCQALSKDASLSLSGLNVVKDDGWYVCMGRKGEGINILPPFNGEGDHLIFRVTDKTYFRRFDMPYYNLLSNSSYSLIEEFVHPYRVLCAGFFWFHMNAMRERYRKDILRAKKKYVESFVPVREFLGLRYKDIVSMADRRIYSLRQNVLFSFIYKGFRSSIKENLNILDNMKA